MNANIPVSVITQAVTVGASASPVVTSNIRISSGGSKYFRFDIFVGATTVATAVAAKLQHSSGYNLWTDTKSVSITASTNTTATADATTDVVTATGHGLTSGDPITFNSTGTLPGGIEQNVVYYAIVLTANTLKVSKSSGLGVNDIVDITSNGTATITVTLVRQFEVKFLPEVAGDQTHLPLKAAGRVVVTTGAGDSCQVLNIIKMCEE